MNNKKILIVDDNPTGLHTLLAILKNDYTVFIATNGKNALQKAQTEPKPDVILLDVIMPDMDGYEVCEKLKQNSLTAHIPIIFITALDDDTEEEKGLNLGAIDYIHKPFNSTIVKTRLKNHLALVHAHQKLAEQNQQLIETAKLKDDIERITNHDLKSQLNAIIGYPQILKQDDNLTPEQKQDLELIETAGYQILNIINHSLDLYKIETGSYSLNPVPLDIIEHFKKVISINQKIINDKNITLEILCNELPLTDESFLIYGESLLCHTMLENLLKNALEASAIGQSIQIFLTEKDDDVIIKIRNFGSVPENIRDNFFDKYVTAGKKEGTGLGTYSAALSVKVQKGSIYLDCSEAGMTTLKIKLPKYILTQD